jgi:hypothetical protein
MRVIGHLCGVVMALCVLAMGLEVPMVQGGERLYFIGNSYMGNLGGVYNYMRRALEAGTPPVTVNAQYTIYYGQGLGSMFTTEVQNNIRNMQWDYVVIIRGSTTDMMRFYNLCREEGIKLIVYATWARNPTINSGGLPTYASELAGITSAMRDFVAQTDSNWVTICPIATAYGNLILNPPHAGLRADFLYEPENIHENILGHILSSYTLYATLTGRSPVGLDYDYSPYVVGDSMQHIADMRYDEQMRAAIQQGAWDAFLEWYGGSVRTQPMAPRGMSVKPLRQTATPATWFDLLGRMGAPASGTAAAIHRQGMSSRLDAKSVIVNRALLLP